MKHFIAHSSYYWFKYELKRRASTDIFMGQVNGHISTTLLLSIFQIAINPAVWGNTCVRTSLVVSEILLMGISLWILHFSFQSEALRILLHSYFHLGMLRMATSPPFPVLIDFSSFIFPMCTYTMIKQHKTVSLSRSFLCAILPVCRRDSPEVKF